MGESRVILVGTNERPDGADYFLPDEDHLRVIRELQRNGLVTLGENLDEFLPWIKDGPFVPVYRLEGLRHFRASRALTGTEENRLRKQYYALNELGHKAWDAVLRAILEQLRAPASTPVSDSPAK
jgi:hypothetical protein